MKKFFIILICSFLLPVGAFATTITVNDPANDQIGNSVFDSSFIKYTVNEKFSVTIGTNYPQAGYTVGDWGTLPADLLIDNDINGEGWDYAIPLVDHDGFFSGQLYNITSLSVSDDFAPSTGNYIYNHNIPVQIATGSSNPDYTSSGGWQWNSTGSNPAYNIVYTPDADWGWYNHDNPSRDNFLTIGWATATCANDPIGVNPVPEPATILLMGIGVLGLVGYSRKRKKS